MFTALLTFTTDAVTLSTTCQTLSTPGIAFACAATTAALTLFAIVAAFAKKSNRRGSSAPAMAAVEVSGGIGLMGRRSGGKSKSQQHGRDEQALADKYMPTMLARFI